MTVDQGGRSLAGAGWTLLAFGVTRGITMAATLVLARLLDPGDFGLMAIALLVVAVLGSVSTLGLRGTLVVERYDNPLLATTLMLLLTGGAAGAAVVAVAAGPIASLFGDPELEPVLRAMSIMLLLGGAVAFYEALLQRALRFRARFVTQFVQAVVFAAVSVGSAVAGAGVWSLVAGQVAGTLAYVLALGATAGTRVRPALEPRLVRRALLPARGFLAHGLVQQVQQNLDVAAAGYFLGPRATGYYSMAYRLADLPYVAFTDPVAAVAFPTIARRHRRREPTAEPALQLLAIVTLFTCPVCLLMSAAAEPFVRFALGAEWVPMAGALSVLGGWAAIVQVEAALGWFLNSLGLAGINAAISAIVTVPAAPALFVAAASAGIVGVAWVMLAAGVLTTTLFMVWVRRATGIGLTRQLRPLAGIAAASVALWAAARATVAAVPDAAALPALALAAAAGLAAYAVVLRVLDPAALRTGRRFAADAAGSLRGTA